MILDVATMRVIYYTDNLDEPLTVVERTLVYDYIGELPAGMKLSNSWNYRLVGNKLVNTEAQPAKKPTLLDSNRSEALKLLNDRINQARAPLLPTNHGGEWVRRLKLEDPVFLDSVALILGQDPQNYSQQVRETKLLRDQQLKNSELNRLYYRKLLSEAKTNEDILALRDEFANADLLVLQVK